MEAEELALLCIILNTLFRFRVLYGMQTEEQKMGEAWKRG